MQVKMCRVKEQWYMAQRIGNTALKAIQHIKEFLIKHSPCKEAKKKAMKKAKLLRILRMQALKMEKLMLSYKNLDDRLEQIRTSL